jgi:hypothetical protein
LGSKSTKSGGRFLNNLDMEGLTTGKEPRQRDNGGAITNSINKIVTAPFKLHNSTLGLLNAQSTRVCIEGNYNTNSIYKLISCGI